MNEVLNYLLKTQHGVIGMKQIVFIKYWNIFNYSNIQNNFSYYNHQSQSDKLLVTKKIVNLFYFLESFESDGYNHKTHFRSNKRKIKSESNY